MRLTWSGMLCVVIGSLFVMVMLDHLGRFELTLPVLGSIISLGFAIAVKWRLRTQAWFWATLAIIASLHVLLVLSISWPTKWIPATIITGIGILDFYAIFGIVSGIEILIGRASKGRDGCAN